MSGVKNYLRILKIITDSRIGTDYWNLLSGWIATGQVPSVGIETVYRSSVSLCLSIINIIYNSHNYYY
jgi:hypothetical protein